MTVTKNQRNAAMIEMKKIIDRLLPVSGSDFDLNGENILTITLHTCGGFYLGVLPEIAEDFIEDGTFADIHWHVI